MKLIISMIIRDSTFTITIVPIAVIVDSIIIIIFLLYLSDIDPIIGLKINPPIPSIASASAA